MKLIISLLITLFLAACGKEGNTPTHTISILYDVTGDTLPYDSEAVIHLFETETDLFKERSFRFQQLTDVDVNKVQEVHLPSASEWFSNHDDREREVGEFESQVEKIGPQWTGGYEKSSLWIPVCKEINFLHGLESGTRELYVISDLREHSDIVSFYDPATINRVFSDPESIRNELSPYLPEESYLEIDITFVYRPRDSEDNQFYRQLIDSVYTPLFNQRGITIKRKATL